MNTSTRSLTNHFDIAERRDTYQRIQVAGIVGPFVDELSRTRNLDAVWAVAFPYVNIVHPLRPTLTLSGVIKRAEREAAIEHMRVDSLESARRVLIKAGNYSEWTEKSYAPLVELLDMAISNTRSKLTANS